nr:uncharacterized protein LOC128669777 [Plodia interpunctella]
MRRYIYCLMSLLVVHICDSKKPQILVEKNIHSKSLQHLHNPDNIPTHHPYFPEVEYPKHILDAHKPFFYKKSDAVYEPFVAEVQTNFKSLTKKANENEKKEIVNKPTWNENVNKRNTNHLDTEEINNTKANIGNNPNKANAETAYIREPNASDEDSDENEDYYISNEISLLECNDANSFYDELKNQTNDKVRTNGTEDISNFSYSNEEFDESVTNIPDILKINNTIIEEIIADLVSITPVTDKGSEELVILNSS